MRSGTAPILPHPYFAPIAFLVLLSIRHSPQFWASVFTLGVNVMSTSLLQIDQGLAVRVSRDFDNGF